MINTHCIINYNVTFDYVLRLWYLYSHGLLYFPYVLQHAQHIIILNVIFLIRDKSFKINRRYIYTFLWHVRTWPVDGKIYLEKNTEQTITHVLLLDKRTDTCEAPGRMILKNVTVATAAGACRDFFQDVVILLFPSFTLKT